MSTDFLQMKMRFNTIKEKARKELADLQTDNSQKSELLSKAVDVISQLGNFYATADVNRKQKLLGSIFPEMIEFDGEKCRTTKINEALALCLSFDKGLSKKENRILPEKLEVSGWVDLKQVEQRFYWPIESDDTDLKHFRNRTLLRKSKNVIDTEFTFQFVIVSNDSDQLTTRQIKPVHSPSLKRA